MEQRSTGLQHSSAIRVRNQRRATQRSVGQVLADFRQIRRREFADRIRRTIRSRGVG